MTECTNEDHLLHCAKRQRLTEHRCRRDVVSDWLTLFFERNPQYSSDSIRHLNSVIDTKEFKQVVHRPWCSPSRHVIMECPSTSGYVKDCVRVQMHELLANGSRCKWLYQLSHDIPYSFVQNQCETLTLKYTTVTNSMIGALPLPAPVQNHIHSYTSIPNETEILAQVRSLELKDNDQQTTDECLGFMLNTAAGLKKPEQKKKTNTNKTKTANQKLIWVGDTLTKNPSIYGSFVVVKVKISPFVGVCIKFPMINGGRVIYLDITNRLRHDENIEKYAALAGFGPGYYITDTRGIDIETFSTQTLDLGVSRNSIMNLELRAQPEAQLLMSSHCTFIAHVKTDGNHCNALYDIPTDLTSVSLDGTLSKIQTAIGMHAQFVEGIDVYVGPIRFSLQRAFIQSAEVEQILHRIRGWFRSNTVMNLFAPHCRSEPTVVIKIMGTYNISGVCDDCEHKCFKNIRKSLADRKSGHLQYIEKMKTFVCCQNCQNCT